MDTISTGSVTAIQIKKPKLIWHKFMSFFFLWICAFFAFKSGMACLTGSALGPYKDKIYEAFPGMHYLYAGFGAAALVIAAFTVYACFELIKYKKDAPRDLFIALSAQILATLIFEAIAGFILGFENLNLSQSAVAVVLQSLILLVNIIYFKKNKAYFTK